MYATTGTIKRLFFLQDSPRPRLVVLPKTGTFLLMRKLRIDALEAVKYVADADALEALAFAILVKQTFVSSSINDISFRHIKKTLHVGTNTARRCIANGIKLGFLRRGNNGRRLIANKLHEKGWSATVSRAMFGKATRTSKQTGRRILTISRLKDIIREVVLLNHIRKQNDCTDTHNIRQGKAKSSRDIRRARRRESRMLKTEFREQYIGLSNLRIMKILGAKRGKALSVIKTLIDEKLITRRLRWSTLTGIDNSVSTFAPSVTYDSCGHLQLIWAARNCVRTICSNTYRIRKDIFSKR